MSQGECTDLSYGEEERGKGRGDEEKKRKKTAGEEKKRREKKKGGELDGESGV